MMSANNQILINKEFIFKDKKYIQGLYGVPESYKNNDKMNNPDEWWWEERTKKEDNKFLYKTAINNNLKDILK